MRRHARPVVADRAGSPARAGGATCPRTPCLLPRRTLRELISARGLVISDDVPFVRTFAARRWVGGLAERLGPLSGPLTSRRRPAAAVRAVSLSLGDERVILAHRTPVRTRSSRCCAAATAARRCTSCCPPTRRVRTIPDVVAEMPVEAADRALLIDDASPDETTSVALQHGLDVLRHPANRGYGASQKTGYVRALRDGAEVIVMVHADNQYDPGLVAEMAAPILAGEADVVIGSRLLDDRAIAGGMPRWKWLGNRLLTGDREPRVRRALLRVPHGLPGVQRRLPALDPVPAQLRRLRLRPGDLRPDARARRARA